MGKTDVSSVLDGVKAFLEDHISLGKLDTILNSYMENSEQYKKENSKSLFSGMVQVIFSHEKINEFYYLMAALYKTTMLAEAYQELIRTVIENNSLTKENKYFAYWQFSKEAFLNPAFDSHENRMLLDDLYEDIYETYIKELSVYFTKIPKEMRNRELVFVITSQVLSMEHGPTKTLLDRCYVLEEILHKRVFIINTGDLLTLTGKINWYRTSLGSYDESLSNRDYLAYKNHRFMFYQCPQIMPDVRVISEILTVVKEEKPWFIVAVGGDNITADLCAKIVPVLTISTVPSKIAEARTTFQMTGHRIDDIDRKWLSNHGYDESTIISGLFTSAFKEQTHIYSREQLGLPVDKTICLVVGFRLDEEMDEDFINVIREISHKDIYTAIMGKYEKYSVVTENDDYLNNHIIYLGMQEDALAVYECCDIYINPRRRGGGTSLAEALSKGLPAVTLKYGDVATGAGEDFCVENHNKMIERIIKLAEDKLYYKTESDKAKKRATSLMDSASEFVRIISEMESRENFW